MSQVLHSRLSKAFDVGRVLFAKVIILVAIAARISSGRPAYSLLYLSFDLSILQQSFSKVNRQHKVLFLGALVPPSPSVAMTCLKSILVLSFSTVALSLSVSLDAEDQGRRAGQWTTRMLSPLKETTRTFRCTMSASALKKPLFKNAVLCW